MEEINSYYEADHIKRRHQRRGGRQGALQTCRGCLCWSAVNLLGEDGFANGGVQSRLQEQEKKGGISEESNARGK